jgi:antitoxin (DNA-binding transcriptional repressor) of toxin-antitoxin stability system
VEVARFQGSPIWSFVQPGFVFDGLFLRPGFHLDGSQTLAKLIDSTHRNDHGHTMDISVTQLKAKCLGVVDKVQKERCRVRIRKFGRIAAEIVPWEQEHEGSLWARGRESTRIVGDLIETNEPWDAET